MVHKLIKIIFAPLICSFIIISSLHMDKAPSAVMLIVAGCIFCLSIVFDEKFPVLAKFQIVFLALFHWFSHLNWCLILYFLLIAFAVQKKRKYTQTIPIGLMYMLLYTLVRLSYMPISSYNLLVSVNDIISSVVFVLLVQYVFNSELEKKRLRTENTLLITRDPLTGLLNYEGYVSTLQDLINKKYDFVIVLLDFQDFKSVNNERIRNGNETLTTISHLLNHFFSDSFAISRYAGDRFAIILPPSGNFTHKISEILDSYVLGFPVLYSFVQFPQESVTKEELISIAEDRLFQNKRNAWLKREEDLVRSEKMKVVGELAAGMAHEIRNPLTTIKGFMQMSTQHQYNIQPWFDVIMGEITRMNELTAEFLQFSKPHIGNMKPELIADCIERVLSLTESEALNRGHTIIFEGTNQPIYIYIDRDKIVQVLLNLIKNAFEAMKQPGDIYVRMKQEENTAIIEIEDTGKGISESELSKIFTPFYTTKETGTGLGLSICQKIAQDHGGTLVVRSVIGQGSEFSLKLPAFAG